MGSLRTVHGLSRPVLPSCLLGVGVWAGKEGCHGGGSSRGLGHDLLSPINESSLSCTQSSFYEEHIYKDDFLFLFPTRLFFIDLPSTSHSFVLFRKSTHHLLMLSVKHKKVFFSPANHRVQPKPRWSWPCSLLWKQTFQMHPERWLSSVLILQGLSLLTSVPFWATEGRWVCVGNLMKNEA